MNLAEISDSEIDPPGFNQLSIRGALVESNIQPKVMSKAEAIGKATVVREVKNGKRKSKKYKGKDKNVEAKADVTEVENEEGEDEEDENEVNIARQKNETPEERKARKDLIKQMKSDRKNKKKNFKEKYENMKKGYLMQNRAQTQTDGTQGVPVYRIN
jgi:hypothetical protein